MTQRDTVIEFTRGVMDRLRDYCGIGDVPEGFIEFEEGWSFMAPSGLFYEFRYIGHPHWHWTPAGKGSIGVRVLGSRRGKVPGFAPLLYARNRDEAREGVLLFLRGVSPSSFGETEP